MELKPDVIVHRLRRSLGLLGRVTSLVVLIASIGPGAWAAELVLGVEEDNYEPLYSVRDKQYSGFSRELLDEFARTYRHRFTYVPLPVARLFNEFLDRRTVDLKFPDNPNWHPERKQDIPIVYSNPALLITEGLVVQGRQAGQLAGKLRAIAATRGFTPTPYREAIGTGQLTVIETISAESSLRMVDRGRADGAYINTVVARRQLKRLNWPPERLVFDSSLPFVRSSFSLSSIAYPQVVQQFNEFLRTRQSWLQSLKSKYDIEE